MNVRTTALREAALHLAHLLRAGSLRGAAARVIARLAMRAFDGRIWCAEPLVDDAARLLAGAADEPWCDPATRAASRTLAAAACRTYLRDPWTPDLDPLDRDARLLAALCAAARTRTRRPDDLPLALLTAEVAP